MSVEFVRNTTDLFGGIEQSGVSGWLMPRTSSAVRSPSGDGSPPSGSQHDRDRLSHLEAAVAAMQQTLDVQFKRIAAMQAELDRLTAKDRKG